MLVSPNGNMNCLISAPDASDTSTIADSDSLNNQRGHSAWLPKVLVDGKDVISSTSPLNPVESMEILYKLGLKTAQRLNVPLCDCEDCALEFCYHCLAVQNRATSQGQAIPWSVYYCQRCATNFVLTFKKRLHKHFQRLVRITSSEDGNKGKVPLLAIEKQVAVTSSIYQSGFDTLPWEILQKKEQHTCITAALMSLTATQRAIFERCAIDGESVSVVAVDLKLSNSAAYSLLSRARRHMRNYLQKTGFVPDHLERL